LEGTLIARISLFVKGRGFLCLLLDKCKGDLTGPLLTGFGFFLLVKSGPSSLRVGGFLTGPLENIQPAFKEKV
jgi:hypothetical protein